MSHDTGLAILDHKARASSYHLCQPLPAIIDGKQSILIGTNVDTEFWQTAFPDHLKSPGMVGRHGVTIQISGVLQGPSIIYDHPDYMAYAEQNHLPLRHTPIQTGFAPVDYLKSLGYHACLDRGAENAYIDSLPEVQFVTYSYFAVAELLQIVQGEYKKDVDQALLERNIVMQRRLRTQDGPSNFPRAEPTEHVQDSMRMPWVLTLDGHPYGIRWCIIDASAVLGHMSYKAFCEVAGILLDAKDIMHDLGLIDKMHIAYQTHAQEYDEYSKGDLYVYDALKNIAANLRQIYVSLGLEMYYRGEARLTIGATIRDLFQAIILQHFDVAPDDAAKREEIITTYCKPATAEYLRTRVDSTMALLAKVEGGRCRNNRPTVAHLTETLVDLDLKGCYGEGQRNQLYPFGRPFVFDYPANAEHNEYLTLRQFLDLMKWGKKKCELVPGLWHARVSIQPDYKLKYAQDFFASWIDFRYKNMTPKVFDPRIPDYDDPEYELNVHTGMLKVFTNSIRNAVVTHDGIQWLEHVASKPQQKELLDNLYVHTAMIYLASQRVESLDALHNAVANHQGRNTCVKRIEDGLVTKIAKTQDCHAWYAINLGDFLVNQLLAHRSLYAKKTPLNEMYKLTVNTLFGDMVSPFFKTSNTTVGNNITARARAACWYMEKGLFALQSITDGGVFDLNKVVFPTDNKQVTAQRLTLMHHAVRLTNDRRIRLAPLGDYEYVRLDFEDTTPVLTCRNQGREDVKRGDDALNWINAEAMHHLQHLFPHIDVLQADSTRLTVKNVNGLPQITYTPRIGQFEFEAKKLWSEATFHGSANYRLEGPGKVGSHVSMRSYEKRTHYTLTLDHGQLISDDRYEIDKPAETFLKALKNPHAVPRASVFVKGSILKPGDYVHLHGAFYQHSPLKPGDELFKAGLLREFSLAQFTFQTPEQFKAIYRQWQRCKDKYTQYIEAFFTNGDGTLDFQRMIETVDLLLSQGCDDLIKALDPHDNRWRDHSREHPETEVFKETKQFLNLLHLRQEVQEYSDQIASNVEDDYEIVSDPEMFRFQAD